MNLRDVRTALAQALADGGVAGVYTDPPGVVTPPAVIVAPDDPYLEPLTIGKEPGQTSVRVRFRLLVAVAQNDTPASLDQLERLVVDVWRALPPGTETSSAGGPSVQQVGPSEMLTTTITAAMTAAT